LRPYTHTYTHTHMSYIYIFYICLAFDPPPLQGCGIQKYVRNVWAAARTTICGATILTPRTVSQVTAALQNRIYIYKYVYTAFLCCECILLLLPSTPCCPRVELRRVPLWKTFTLPIDVYIFPAYNIYTDYIIRSYFFPPHFNFVPTPQSSCDRQEIGRGWTTLERVSGEICTRLLAWHHPTQGFAFVRHRRPLCGTNSGSSRKKHTAKVTDAGTWPDQHQCNNCTCERFGI